MRNKIAGVAAKSRIKPRARPALRQERHLPPGEVALMCQSKQSCGHRVQRLKRDLVRVLLSAGAWAVSAEADDFSEHPGGIQWCWPPGLGEKSPPILAGKQRASSGGYPRGVALLDHFCILFLREKDVPARHERRTTCRWGISRCITTENKIAWDAAVSQTKLRARLPRREAPLTNRAVASFETKSWATRTVSRIKLRARLAARWSAGYRRGISRYGAMGNLVACAAAKSLIKPKARLAAR